MFHACVQKFDGMDEKNLDGELNRALDLSWGGRSEREILFEETIGRGETAWEEVFFSSVGIRGGRPISCSMTISLGVF
jgi:hypothetical protein